MENKMEIFKNEEFGEIRTMIIDNEPWFIGRDVAELLGYGDGNKNSKALSNAIADHVDSEDKKLLSYAELKGYQNGDLKNISHYGASVINESGLYSLILGSKLPTARAFKRWVTSEVLPTIRKHGAYMLPDVLQRAAEDKDYCNHLVGLLNDDVRRKNIITRDTVASDSAYKEWSIAIINPALLQLQSYHPKHTTRELLVGLYSALKKYYSIDVNRIYFDFVNTEREKALSINIAVDDSALYIPKLYVMYLNKAYRAILVSQLYKFIQVELSSEASCTKSNNQGVS